MTILETPLSAREAQRVTRFLRSEGYRITVEQVRQLQTVTKVAQFCEPDDTQVQTVLRRDIAAEVGLQPRRPNQQAA